ncbi:DUF2279 domain-containing protein [Aureibaculum sp. 2210JD6-5]|uniref:DUF2279 domain-containing protein n=1 Tax=Aureibaculum sp. 2210JD6-5 TaxID=3103957 RepID=UPI002AAC67AD|nr:DUF2279 domain-containing protein [Aureibaculum sp. 2210JD6-5]MDY7393734.1 DUF2279 domain-containing protein [Aureibaculum sp. 2210JD6-5]
MKLSINLLLNVSSSATPMAWCAENRRLQATIFKQLLIFVFLVFFSFSNVAQQKSSFWEKSDSLNIKRRNTVYITEAAAASLTLVGMHQLWYANYDSSSFHTINDSNDWLQMDKVGHAMGAYYVGKVGMDLLDWAGESKKNQLIYGATLGFGFLSAVEIFDGFSKEWGFSPSDILANASGAGLLIGQELLWNEQRILMKYSFHTTKYAEQRPELLGESFLEQTLKDYNGQTYWLSANIWSFAKESRFPKWLNVAVGYGADGMISGSDDYLIQTSLNVRPERIRQFYLSLDVDLTKIKTESKFIKTLFSTINFIKIPAPTLEISSQGKAKFHPMYF